MAKIQQSLRKLFISKFFNKPEILKDEAKYTLFVSRFLLTIVNLWPENYGLATKISFIVTLITYILIQLSLIIYMMKSTEDVSSLTKAVSPLAVGTQTIVKMSAIFLKTKQLHSAIKIVWYEFWPANLLGKDIENQIHSESKILLLGYLIQYSSAVIFMISFIIIPFISADRKLPYNSWYPFDWSKSPAYEILFVLQMYKALYLDENIICGYDYLFCSICANCSAQFRLLSEAIRLIGTGKESELTDRLLAISGVTYQPVKNSQEENERKLLVICIKHHQRLINLTTHLNELFNYGHFVQLAASIMGICASCYLISESGVKGQHVLISYFSAHLFQLLVYCAVSNDLIHWSMELSIATFQCSWYNNKYTDVRRALCMVIARSQKPIIMNALGLFELSYASFLTVMRFTFSLYTFLDKMANK